MIFFATFFPAKVRREKIRARLCGSVANIFFRKKEEMELHALCRH